MTDDHHEHHHDGPHDYVGAVQGYRAEKDEFFRTNPAARSRPRNGRRSPACRTTRSTSTSCSRACRSSRTPGVEPSTFEIPTSDNRLRPARRAGSLAFDVDGQSLRLTAYELEGAHSDGRVFVPFLDETSGTETYGAGRYLDLEPDEDGTYAIDFNLAYHPTCVYSPTVLVPVSPRRRTACRSGSTPANGSPRALRTDSANAPGADRGWQPGIASRDRHDDSPWADLVATSHDASPREAGNGCPASEFVAASPAQPTGVATPSASAMAARWAGVEPQHAPMIRAPAVAEREPRLGHRRRARRGRPPAGRPAPASRRSTSRRAPRPARPRASSR